MAGVLDGILVLDWCQFQQGNAATAMLADFGATVIHIEDRVYGDPGRGVRARTAGVGNTRVPQLPHGRSWYFETFNRGKKSLTVDLSKEKGKEVVYRLVKKSDVFVHNFRQGVPEKLGVDYETLSRHNPRLIYAAGSGYGPNGPDSREPAFDLLGQARSGIMSMVGEPEMPPMFAEIGIADQVGGMMISYGVLLALLARQRYGIGQKIDVSLLGSMMALQSYLLGSQLYLNQDSRKHVRSQATNPLWNYYQCQDGKWLVLSMGQSDRYWPTVCKGLGINQLEQDPRFVNMMARIENCEELIRIMDDVFLTRSAAKWKSALKEAGDVICDTVQNFADLLKDPQVLSNNYIVDCNHEVLGPVKLIGTPVVMSETPAVIRCEAPELGQHTEEILTELGGYSWEEIGRLRDEEVI